MRTTPKREFMKIHKNMAELVGIILGDGHIHQILYNKNIMLKQQFMNGR